MELQMPTLLARQRSIVDDLEAPRPEPVVKGLCGDEIGDEVAAAHHADDEGARAHPGERAGVEDAAASPVEAGVAKKAPDAVHHRAWLVFPGAGRRPFS